MVFTNSLIFPSSFPHLSPTVLPTLISDPYSGVFQCISVWFHCVSQYAYSGVFVLTVLHADYESLISYSGVFALTVL